MQVGSTWRRSFTGYARSCPRPQHVGQEAHPQAPVANTPTQSERTRATPAIPSRRGGHHENGATLGARNNCQWYSAANHNLDFSSDTGPGWSNGGGDPRLAFAKTEGATLSSDTGVGGSGSYL